MNKATMTDEALKDILVEHAQDKGIKAALTSLVATGRSTTGQPGYTIARGGRPAIRYEYSAASDKEARKTFENPRQKRSDGEELKPAERARLEEMFCELAGKQEWSVTLTESSPPSAHLGEYRL